MIQKLETPDVLANRLPQAFPVLTKAEVARMRHFGTEQNLAEGALLFNEGDSKLPLFVVLEGTVEIVHRHGSVEELVTVHEPGQFTGEINLLAERRSLVIGRARTACRLLRVEPQRLRALVQTDAELSEIIMRAFILRRVGLLASHAGDAVLVGSRHNAATLRAQEFLTRNGHPYQYVDVDADDAVQALLDGFHVGLGDIPVLICRGERVLKNPSNVEIAECLGFNEAIDGSAVHDLVVIGAGPAGLAAAVYAASEGLDVLVIESSSPGGQAGSSSKIENYLGFPTGISGQALAARAFNQAEKFGAQILIAKSVSQLDCGAVPFRLELDDGGESVLARAIVVATGAQYRKLDVPDLARFEGVGVYYGATFLEAQRCASDEVIVVGGGNSAGQAATFLSRSSRHVHMLIRGPSLAATMSRYLVRRIEETPNITLHTRTEVVAIAGGDHLEQVTWVDRTSGAESSHPIRHIFSMAGAKPNTDWLKSCLELDAAGFILTGQDIAAAQVKGSEATPQAPPVGRAPYLLETSVRGVFAVGDVRSESVKRVASAVGEGSVCIQLVHRALAEPRVPVASAANQRA